MTVKLLRKSHSFEVREMKRIFVVLVCALTMFAFLSSASAIDRNRKSKDSDKKEKATEIEKMTKEKAEAQKKSRAAALKGKTIRSGQSRSGAVPNKSGKAKKESEAKGTGERYDYFQDSDNNGVNDRLQQKEMKKKAEAKEVVKPKSPPAKKKDTPTKVAPSSSTTEKAKQIKAKEPKKKPEAKEPQKNKMRDKR